MASDTTRHRRPRPILSPGNYVTVTFRAVSPGPPMLSLEGQNAAMGECILRLYRDAAQPAMAELGRNLERAAAWPGLSIMATEDHLVGTDEQRRRASARAGAAIAELDGLGHWWFTQDPQRGAATINDFWAGVGPE